MGNSVPDVGFVGEGIEPADAALVGTEAEQALALRMPGQAHHLCIRILGRYKNSVNSTVERQLNAT